jgi:(5-formylfuran-3-yl)methyl phosphate synthase
VRLLVSVRNAVEARAALAGGGEIIDAKEPGAGALGPVSGDVLRAIRAVVPAEIPFSAALGDVASREEVVRAFAQIGVPLSFVKLGFRGITDGARIQALLATAVETALGLPGAPQVVAVAYADHARMESLAAAEFPPLVAAAGASGLLVDTGSKDGQHLFDHLSPASLATLAGALAGSGAFLALGGSLDAGQLSLAGSTGAAIVGVRGAACVGGRNGVIEEGRVRKLSDVVRSSETVELTS